MKTIDKPLMEALVVILQAHDSARTHLSNAVDPEPGHALEETLNELLGCFDTKKVVKALEVIRARVEG